MKFSAVVSALFVGASSLKHKYALRRALPPLPEGTPTYGNETCPCISLEKIDKSTHRGYPTYKKVDENGVVTLKVPYPEFVGTKCELWDQTYDKTTCTGKTDKDHWCNRAWCYVDPCTCETMAKKSSYFPTLKTTDKKPVFYSYTTCTPADAETVDTFTCTSPYDPTKHACTCNTNSSSCAASVNNCRWSENGVCISKDLGKGACSR